ncbi:hypothetical protein [Desulfocurvus sp. DL9XJH121]
MRWTPLFLFLFLALIVAFATPVTCAEDSQEREALSRVTDQAAPSGSHSVRLKVSPVTYGGSHGQQVAPAPDKQDSTALERPVPDSRYRVRLHLDAAAPHGPSDSVLAARSCARRLMALVEQDLLSRARFPGMAA